MLQIRSLTNDDCRQRAHEFGLEDGVLSEDENDCDFLTEISNSVRNAMRQKPRVDDGYVLRLLGHDSEAKCLDGSPGGYYINANGTDLSKWIIHLEGGGWCVSKSDCAARSKTVLGSSVGWPERGLPDMDGGSHAMMSQDAGVNPDFASFSKVFVNYCDGGSFAGTRTAGLPFRGQRLYLAGRGVLAGAMRDLLAGPMAQATQVLVKGTSAGGLGVLLGLDWLASLFPPGTRVGGLADAGLFVAAQTWDRRVGFASLWRQTAHLHRAALPPRCVAAQGPGKAKECFVGAEAARHVEASLMVANSLADSWVLQHVLRLPCLHALPSCQVPPLPLVPALESLGLLKALGLSRLPNRSGVGVA